MTKQINRVAVIGTGVIGSSWTAWFLAQGLDVVAFDQGPDAEQRLKQYVDAAWPALEALGLAPRASRARLTFTRDLPAAAADVDLVQENGPERLDLKRAMYERLDTLLPPEVPIASSSSGLTMSNIQAGCKSYPQRCVIGHPFNLPHLIPLVEIVAGEETSEETVNKVTGFYTSLGKRTIRVRKEIPGHVANRLQAALWREMVHLVSEGVVSVADADTAVCHGPGLRWGLMGPTMLFHLGGGKGGIENFLDQFTGPMTAWWKALGSPELTPNMQQAIIDGARREAAGQSVGDLAAQCERMLLDLLKLRQSAGSGASIS
ncbi:3-hydroxyacyl-CoA dehydrogenase NAD-binding domain-containing protein [Paraburkholderia sp. CNPSo 3274]|uniref:3-hydroxyacyl-CoA dehydrogenase NAD-binding domain-containing protein n=1 Tax=Paraburkholderia sp. CNPSo 3274 TaxID=2940932 RepID=UPI0020B78415|nr:3-hydroxyacyl-CoA dehydrogenase NAD-binding domain-containing protein [Paraburkholderia sp. CNPSo 3274]MCP3705581.1 3-hydroxyacyl-CoA dehydrogenase NAD-binding domain-containing protein [Paraburkholderia sp. CNPSo 3274]